MFAGSILPKTTVFSSSVALPCVRNNIRSIKPCRIVCQADNNNNGNPKKNGSKGLGIGDLLGPIGLTIAKTIDREVRYINITSLHVLTLPPTPILTPRLSPTRTHPAGTR